MYRLAQSSWGPRLISPSLHLSGSQAVAVLAAGLIVFGSALARASVEPVQSLVLAFGLVYASVIDFDRRILPNPLTVGLIVVGLAAGAIFRSAELDDRIIGAVAGYASLVLVEVTYRALRKRDGLGRGDAKLFAAGGAWLGWASLPAVMLVASMAALVVVIAWAFIRRRLDARSPVAFGPFISLGIWAMWLLQS